METITLSLHTDDADKVYAAVGRQLAKGDLDKVEGQSQFSTAFLAAFGHTQSAPAAPETPGTTPIGKAFAPKK